jgi:hypothetical protein
MLKSKPKEISIKSILNWLDQNILLILSSFLLLFIPLFPKLPLFDVIPGYIVRVRPEDILILITAIIWIIQLARKKISIKTPLTKIVIAYAIIGLLSTISAVFITKTVPLQPLHVGKSLLHFFRYIEYFSLFFIVYTAVKSRKDLKILLAMALTAIIGVGIYGLGQKYLYWPVYSTMNREFSKGIRLYLTEHARVQSTFGGHYDLAAYLVVVLPLVFAILLTAKKKLHQLALWGVFLIGLWSLVVSGSRSSFAAFLFAAMLVIVFKSFDFKTLLQKIVYIFKKTVILGILVSLMMIIFGDDMYERLLQSIEGYPIIYQPYTKVASSTVWFVNDFFPSAIGLSDENKNRWENMQDFKLASIPDNALSTEEAEVLVSSDQQPTSGRPSDVYVNVPDIQQVATISASGKVEIINQVVPRTYSDNAIRHGLSLAIRLDTLWPQALQGFYRNPLLGSGYATLTKSSIGQFTEAESTDNNFLRTLGETGLLGFASFYGAILIAIGVAIQIWRKTPKNLLNQALAIGFISGSIGLLLNAVYIDVYAASKVAFTYWSLAGIVLAILNKKFTNTNKSS